MSDEVLKKLTESAKLECKITWSDSDTDRRIKEIVEDASLAMKSKLGMSEDSDDAIFTQPGEERMLWKSLVLYMWNDMQSMFDTNYRANIQQVRRKYEVAFEKSQKSEIV